MLAPISMQSTAMMNNPNSLMVSQSNGMFQISQMNQYPAQANNLQSLNASNLHQHNSAHGQPQHLLYATNVGGGGSIINLGNPTSYNGNLLPGMMAPNPIGMHLPTEIVCKEEMDFNLVNTQVCAICGDKVTGKHYGAFSCDGCKGFFRRSVRKNHQYTCRNNRNCLIDKDKRNQCRYCRMQKCNKAGMRREAVQNERDKISCRRHILDEYSASPAEITRQTIIDAEIYMRKSCAKSHEEYFKNVQMPLRQATLANVSESMQQQLKLLVDWAKKLPCFVNLSLDDQMALLKSNAGELLILGVVFRSIKLDMLILGNDFVISKDVQNPDIKRVSDQIFNKLFYPLKDIQIDETEYACLKSVIFFDPHAKGLSPNQQEHIHKIRFQIQLDMMYYMLDKQYDSVGRFGETMLLLPDLRSITQVLIEQVKSSQNHLQNLNSINDLLCEMLLADTNGKPASVSEEGSSRDSSSVSQTVNEMMNNPQYNLQTLQILSDPHTSGQVGLNFYTNNGMVMSDINSAARILSLNQGHQQFNHFTHFHNGQHLQHPGLLAISALNAVAVSSASTMNGGTPDLIHQHYNSNLNGGNNSNMSGIEPPSLHSLSNSSSSSNPNNIDNLHTFQAKPEVEETWRESNAVQRKN